MACGACCEILGIGHASEARDIMSLSRGSKECPLCSCDYCEMHYRAIKVGSDKWRGGCPVCIETDSVYIEQIAKMSFKESVNLRGCISWIGKIFKRTTDEELKEQLEDYQRYGTIPEYK